MRIYKYRNDLTPYLRQLKAAKKSIGFVPTMGALHAGHISLIEMCRKENDVVICSIFINPTQFNEIKDLEQYPRTLSKDIEQLIQAGCNILYIPLPEDVYGKDIQVKDFFDFEGLDKRLEGASREGHFAGVAQVVKILLEIVKPNRLYLGQKDYQQFLILSKLIEFLYPDIKIIMGSIVREETGLAMSSRNERLAPELRVQAGIIYNTLLYAYSLIDTLPFAEIEKTCISFINNLHHFKIDYFEIVNAENLQHVNSKRDAKKLSIITAVYADGVRLIDNILVE